ncbi:hypothetical protein L2E82_04569 [Cichorium intybus]|uniref:Uncharacterized protein n=1 Tax=Cichorium intybus TaxID=13427 RepID=A0ACB9H787_CICIN|nr:hypothetical protein L2E82_04569 [Cichorium intybus]
MLSFARLPLYFWADAIATACFTQNRSTINKRFLLTPYEILNKRIPNNKVNPSVEIFPTTNQATIPLMNLYEEFMNLVDEPETAKSSQSNTKDNQEDELLKIVENAATEAERTPEPAETTPTTQKSTPTLTPNEKEPEISHTQEDSSVSQVQGRVQHLFRGEGSTPTQGENIPTFEGEHPIHNDEFPTNFHGES